MRATTAILFALALVGCTTATSEPTWNGNLSEKIPEPVRTALEQSPEFELVSLDPKHRDEDSPSEFYRRRVIGKTVVKDAATRNRLLGALDASVRAEKNMSAACFDPRHAIRVAHGGKEFYLAICFHCGHIYFFVDNRRENENYFATDYSPLTVFDEALKAAGVPLAKDGMLEDELEAKPNRN
jgi:hypothetical protein